MSDWVARARFYLPLIYGRFIQGQKRLCPCHPGYVFGRNRITMKRIRFKQAKQLIWILVLIAMVFAYNILSDKPYCAIELQGEYTVRGERKNILLYLFSKFYTERKEFAAHPSRPDETYGMYMYVNDPDGLAHVIFAVDGVQTPVEFLPGQKTIDKEWRFPAKIGWHWYNLDVMDMKGNRSASASNVHVVEAK